MATSMKTYSDPWLFELHTKLWKRDQLPVRSSLFRTVEVTLTHFTELRARLDAATQVDRSDHNIQYKSNNVSSIKRDLLNNFVPGNGGSKLDDLEKNDTDPDALLEILPATIRYVDITPLDLTHPLRVEFPLLIRDEYDVISTMLNNRKEGFEGSCLVTGPPGIGEHSLIVCPARPSCSDKFTGVTSYLHILLIDRLLKGQNTIFQSKEGTVYQISDTVEQLARYSVPILAGDDVVALVDGDGDPAAPALEVLDSGARIVITTPPQDKESRKWMEELPGGPQATTFMMNPWSLKEHLLTGSARLQSRRLLD
jgi:hypothetical protein